MFDLLIRNGRIVDGTGRPSFLGDVGIETGKITAVGRLGNASARTTLDATDRVVSPGFVDAHVHGDLALMADPYHEPAVRQGVTTYILGQDGVAFAPGGADVQSHMRQYTAGFNGNFPSPGRTWDGIAGLLSQYDRRCAINACVLIPNGNVRMMVMGLDARPATADELARMKAIVREGMEEGAVGLSSGLDYIPSLYADERELTELCKEIAPFDGVYVTHMRGYAPAKFRSGFDEALAIGRGAGCGVHISHFNVVADQAIPAVEAARAVGDDVTYDLYGYLHGSTILSMVALPPEFQAGELDETIARLKAPATRRRLEAVFADPPFPIRTIRLSSVQHPEWCRYEGMLLTDAVVAHVGRDGLRETVDFVCDLLIATNVEAGCVIRHYAERGEHDLPALIQHPAMLGGSDGIFVGGHPHPRGTGCFARYLGVFVRNGIWPLETAVRHLSHLAAFRFGLSDRGLILVGMAADVVVFDPDSITDRSTYENGKELAVGVDHVAVNGELVLHAGQRTPALPGRGLRRRSDPASYAPPRPG